MPETLWAFLGDETPEAEQLIGSMAAWSAQVQKSHGSNTEKTNEIKAIGLPWSSFFGPEVALTGLVPICLLPLDG